MSRSNKLSNKRDAVKQKKHKSSTSSKRPKAVALPLLPPAAVPFKTSKASKKRKQEPIPVAITMVAPKKRSRHSEPLPPPTPLLAPSTAAARPKKVKSRQSLPARFHLTASQKERQKSKGRRVFVVSQHRSQEEAAGSGEESESESDTSSEESQDEDDVDSSSGSESEEDDTFQDETIPTKLDTGHHDSGATETDVDSVSEDSDASESDTDDGGEEQIPMQETSSDNAQALAKKTFLRHLRKSPLAKADQEGTQAITSVLKECRATSKEVFIEFLGKEVVDGMLNQVKLGQESTNNSLDYLSSVIVRLEGTIAGRQRDEIQASLDRLFNAMTSLREEKRQAIEDLGNARVQLQERLDILSEEYQTACQSLQNEIRTKKSKS